MPFMAAWAASATQPAPEGEQDPDGQGHPAAPEVALADAAAEIVADHRELGHGRVDDPLAQVGAAVEQEPEHGHGHQQQREQREEPVVGEQGRLLAGLVLAVLLDHGHREGQPASPLLEVVDGLHQPRDRFHGLLVPTRYLDRP
jgi:hypothetical protein